MSEQQHHDSPYSDAPRSSKPSRPKAKTSHQRPASPHRSKSGSSHPRQARSRTDSVGALEATARPKPSRRRRRGNGTYRQPDELTSHPTTRNAYVETREWLLSEHGPVCAYCANRYSPSVMTLDHVAPRRGQTAYDRRDNLVLACQTCNAAKRDLAPLAFLLGSPVRAKNLVRFGSHLSPGLLDMARSLLPEGYDADSPYRD